MNPAAKRIVTFTGVTLSLLIAAYLMVRQKYPIINDIATDPNAPLPFFAPHETSGVHPDHLNYMSDFGPKQRMAYPHLAPLAVAAPPELVYQAALELAEDVFAWEVVAQDPENLRFQAIATTQMMRFKDDVVVSVAGDSMQTIVQMRSKSRTGKGDFGTNARRIDEFFKALALSAEELTPNAESGSELIPIPEEGESDEVMQEDLLEELPADEEDSSDSTGAPNGDLAPDMDLPRDEPAL